MVAFALYKSGVYLAAGDLAHPRKACVGFLFQDAARTDPTFVLSQASWTDPAQQGFFVFFVPSDNRDWALFATNVRALFAQTQTAQFAWVVETGPTVSAAELILVANQGTPTPSVAQAFSLTFNNATLTVPASPFLPAVISFDDTTNAFQFQNPNQSSIQLSVQPPNAAQQTFISASPFLALPMDDTASPNAGSVNLAFSFATTDLVAFEAGFMFFGPGAADLLTALSYPFLRAPGGAATPLQFSVWLDVLRPLVDTRSYFQCSDPLVGCYYTTAMGKAVALSTIGGDPSRISRLVFANRPVKTTSDTGTYYYLTPAGAFGLGIDGGANTGTADLLCGTAGTEFLTVSVDQGGPDTLVFTPGQPAFQLTTPSNTQGKPPSFLNSMNGNVTTAWAQLVTSAGSYVSQPQESPLFDQPPAGALKGAGGTLNVYLLDFLPLPTWSATNAARLTEAGSAETPVFPMVPFAGLLLATPELALPYTQMESTALNPTRKNSFTGAKATPAMKRRALGHALTPAADADLTYAMTPQGLLAGLSGTAPNQIWETTRIAISPGLQSTDPAIYLQFTAMEDQIREALQQNQIFLVISTLTNPNPPGNPLFSFAGTDQQINIAGWPFSLSPTGTPSTEAPPIVLLKFYPGHSIKDLVADTSLWSQADTFNGPGFCAKQAQNYIQTLIQDACEAVYGAGNCPDGTPSGQPDTSSLYYNFYQVVTDPGWSGLLALNANMQLNNLPTAIKALTGGMTYRDGDQTVSNIDAFRVHHVGVSINDTDPSSTKPTLSQSSLFGLVDYEKPTAPELARAAANGLDAFYNFEVEYLRALFTNSALGSFACQVNLTINNLFNTPVTGEADPGNGAAGGDDKNIVVITGSYQAHSTSGDDSTSGQGVYSFVAEKTFKYTFDTNPYLDSISLTKLQFSFLQETASQTQDTSTIQASFGIWGSLVFKEFKFLDIFAFKELVFNDLGISVSFDLTVPAAPKQPTTANIALGFNPGNLRLDLAASEPKEGANSLLSLLPFKLTSFLYNQYPDQQTVEDLGYYSLSEVPLDPGFTLTNKFNYGLLFDLDLGRLGALVGSLEAFKFSFLIGWAGGNTTDAGGIAFGVQLPQADGKLQIKIEGVLDLLIEQFILRYETPADGGAAFLVVVLHNASITILGQRLPPGTAQFDFALFAPIGDSARIGWIVAVNNTGGGRKTITQDGTAISGGNGAGDDDGGAFKLVYLGLGQRVGPAKDATPTNFADFLAFMTGDFWDAIENKEYSKVYQPEGQWLALADLKLLNMIEVGFIFYDTTPFYSLTLNVVNLFNFEITYTKVSDSIGLFYANFSLPDSLRTFQVGAASLTLPSIGVSVYTNGDWKLDVGFPANDNWTRSFRVQAQAGPVPVTGSGGFYIANLSSATSDIFVGDYASILAFGFAVRLGVGKDFVAGPLKAGVSVTFFGIIEGAAGYHIALSTDIFKRPDALSLQGQFGVIGELYGSIDFVIIKASVNVRLQASVGIVLKWEPAAGNDGSILLYIQASVSVSVSVEINLFLFSITISFSFNASFRFDWQLAGPSQNAAFLEMRSNLRAQRLAMEAVTTLPLIPAFTPALPIWYTPEGTVVFPSAAANGVPWVVTSLAVQYINDAAGVTGYADFLPFEKIATQLVTWVIGQALGKAGWNYSVLLTDLAALDQEPDILLAGIDYQALLAQLAVFSSTTVIVPHEADGSTVHAATFPMLPFFRLQTTGRLSGTQADDLDYVFSTKNNVSAAYISEVDAYFNQLFVNQTSGGATLLASTVDATTPLVQEIFYDYCSGLIRGAVHQLLETMQNGGLTTSPIDALILAAVKAGQFASLSGQMSSSFRGGARLPYTPGLTVPGGAALTTTNPLYALLWQEFPVGDLGSPGTYTIALTNSDPAQTWVTSTASWDLTSAWLAPLQNVPAGAVIPPTVPVQLPFTDIGPQSFAFENAVAWTQPGGATASLRPFASSLQSLQAALAADIAVLVESRAAGAPYLPGGTTLPPAGFTWGTQVSLTVTQVPGGDGNPLKDIFSLTGASQQDEQLLEQILTMLETENPIAAIQVLYQTAAGSSGLTSQTVTPADVFVLRTNTTTVSAPPTQAFLATTLTVAPPTVPVGAQIDDDFGFLQIVQQAAVTNATGYYLRYLDTSGNSLPATLFSSGPAPLTILITWRPDGTQNTAASPARIRPFYNAIALAAADPALIYYAETTDPALSTQYSTVAPGCIGVIMTRDDTVMKMTPAAALRATASGVDHTRLHRRSELIKALVDAGVSDEAHMHALIAASGGASAQLNALYSLVTYQVSATTGFIQSNLSAPVQPQQPSDASSAADGLQDAGPDTRSYRVYVPLYTLAEANQPAPPIPNRYTSIADPVSMAFFQNDAFGNQMPGSLPFQGANYYFDPLLAVDQWQGIVTAYDFDTSGGPQPNGFTVYLAPSETAFSGLSPEQAAAALQAWTTIQDQITGPGVSFVIETNFALQADGGMVQVTLSAAQAGAVTKMVADVVAWLHDPQSAFPKDPVPLTVTVTGPGALPPVFEMVVLFGIERDPALISPLLKDNDGNITFPSAQRVNTTIVSTVGASLPAGGSVDITAFAAQFVKAFPALALSVGLGGAQANGAQAGPVRTSKTRTSKTGTSKTARAAKALRAAGVAGDGSGGGDSSPQSLWAVQQVLLGITIGVGPKAGPYYVSPTPLDNTLNTAIVPLPGLPPALKLPALPASQLFTDIDLDALNAAFFGAVDLMLAPASAAAAFEQARAAYTAIANGRAQLAQLYSAKEIDWLFPSAAPFTGSVAQLALAEEAFGQQMRAALATAYTTDTVVQYGVAWTGSVPASVGDLFELYGTIQPTGGASLPKGFTLSAPHVPVVAGSQSVLTFLFGVNDVKDQASVTLDLAYNVTHIQHFLQPAAETPAGEARPSMWLQLVNPYATPPHIGPDGTPTIIPLVFREYPTPPTLIKQTAIQGSGSLTAPSDNPLVAAAAWHLQYAYQAQLTVHDQIITAVTYNTDLSASGGSQGKSAALLGDAPVYYTLFEALARFSVTYAVLQPVLSKLADPNWAVAAGLFASLVEDVVNNTTWTPRPTALAARQGPVRITDDYTVTDVAVTGNNRLATLAWMEQESSFRGATLAIEALNPATLVPYPNQVQQTLPQSVTASYTPVPPLSDDWIVHQVEVDGLNVLTAENALSAVQVERNLIEMTDADGKAWYAQSEFVYMTPIVSATQPITPFVDNLTPIDVATLPNQGIGGGCPQAPPPGVNSLCQRIYTLMYDLLADDVTLVSLSGARLAAGLDDSASRRVKMACSFQYPVRSASGVVSANPISPLVPVVLARSFLIDGSDPAQLSDLSGLFAQAVAGWAASNDIKFGSDAQSGAQLVFDITLYAELSGLNTPVLRLRTLQLKTADVAP
jgi:large repetitive protein